LCGALKITLELEVFDCWSELSSCATTLLIEGLVASIFKISLVLVACAGNPSSDGTGIFTILFSVHKDFTLEQPSKQDYQKLPVFP
jgi:hypothetical protein